MAIDTTDASETPLSDPVCDLIFDLLRNAHNTDSPLTPSEVLYNESWLLRIALGFEFKGIPCMPVRPLPHASWLSEPLLYTQFKSRGGGDRLGERHTHADAVLGHLKIVSGTKRGLGLAERATQFVVFESKMFSSLSAGTRNAADFDQATRSLACMAATIQKAERQVDTFPSLGFFVIAPEQRRMQHEHFLDPERLGKKLEARIGCYEAPFRDVSAQQNHCCWAG